MSSKKVSTTSEKVTSLLSAGLSRVIDLKNATKESLNNKYDQTKKYLSEHIDDPNSKLGKMLRPVINHKQEFKVGAAALTAVAFTGVAYKKYQNMKITKLQKEKIEILKKEKMAELKAELDKIEKNKLSAARKKKIMTLFLLGSVGAIILGSKVKSLKKGGSNKKRTLKM